MTRVILPCFLLGMLFVAADCGPTGKGNGGGASLCGSSVVKFQEPCATCMQTNCGDIINGCYGTGWRQAQYSGTCADMFECMCRCDQSDTSCTNTCVANASGDCQQCMAQVRGCQSSNCFSDCSATATGGSGGTAATGGTGGSGGSGGSGAFNFGGSTGGFGFGGSAGGF